MSGSYIPYHLRPCKNVDRKIFIEALKILSASLPVQSYTYVGMGGPFLEDFKSLHAELDFQKMLSLEINERVYQRQCVNRPHACIECRLSSSAELIDNFDLSGNAVIWLDYTNPNELKDQVEEFRSLLPKLKVGDIVKITVNANVATLGDGSEAGAEKLYSEEEDKPEGRLYRKALSVHRHRKLYKILSEYLSDDLKSDDITTRNYPYILLGCLFRAAYLALTGRQERFYPLAACAYADGQKMLTLTGVKTTESGWRDLLSKTTLTDWEFFYKSDESLVDIEVPVLSLQERIRLDSFMPNSDPSDIQREIGYPLAETEKKSLKLIENYLKFYRHYPQYSGIIL
ncbi:hypothetical protein HOP52_19400 [Halomonas campisalis]|uniref:Uncharacterized protein n=1 Tax=Billgrantia campisalis TaxID=74661 RepID=A0ABS9PFL2_9GAMM|nr:O-methyltransferase [Halomonas campisalis]MCG6659910.1 hypothetical protein [Halomonas campisalis]MDR5865109.1 hypothetical protein [Halomonas campisalis]